MIITGDCTEALPAYFLDDSIDAIVTDPPYGLSFMGQDWDTLGKTVGGQIDWHRRWAGEALRVCKPGAHLVAFSGTRTQHYLAAALDLAGWEICDGLVWLYGSGFPKGGTKAKATGREGWGPHLKPGHEPIILAHKPLDGTIRHNVETHGTGVLNIAGCRIEGGMAEMEGRSGTAQAGNQIYGAGVHNPEGGVWKPAEGRFPANVLLDEEAAAMLDAEAGPLRARGNKSPTKRSSSAGTAGPAWLKDTEGQVDSGDSGGPSRFFYCGKASTGEREAGLVAPEGEQRANQHPTVKPIALMRWLVRLVTPPGGLVLDPFTGSGTTGIAAALEGFAFSGIEQDAGHVAIAEQRIAHWQDLDVD